MPLCGGLGNVKDADDFIKEICNKVKEAVETKVGKTYSTYTPVSYAGQVVNGTNYFIKVHVGGEEYIHLRVHYPLPCYGSKPELDGVLGGMKKGDTVIHFEQK